MVGLGVGGGGRGAYAEEMDAFEALARDNRHELHLGDEGDLGLGEARWEGECHFVVLATAGAGVISWFGVPCCCSGGSERALVSFAQMTEIKSTWRTRW